jgi:hypothetical protein
VDRWTRLHLTLPIDNKALAWTRVPEVISDIKATPETVTTDRALEETGGQWRKEKVDGTV